MPEGKWKCKVVKLVKLLFADTLQLFTDLSDNIFVVVICRKTVPSNKGILAAY